MIVYHPEIERTIWRIPIYGFYKIDGISICLLAAWGLWSPSLSLKELNAKKITEGGSAFKDKV